jgi:anti-anti-sigma regulatory factor
VPIALLEVRVLQLVWSSQNNMLRVTRRDSVKAFDLKLEGKLAGRWVDVLEQCWRQAVEESGGKRGRIDLTAVTYVDDRGMDLLGQIHRDGTDLYGSTCLAKGIVEDIQSPQRRAG